MSTALGVVLKQSCSCNKKNCYCDGKVSQVPTSYFSHYDEIKGNQRLPLPETCGVIWKMDGGNEMKYHKKAPICTALLRF